MKVDNRLPAVVRIKPELYAELSKISELTQRPIGEVASMAVRCGLAHSKVTPVQLYKVTFDGEGNE